MRRFIYILFFVIGAISMTSCATNGYLYGTEVYYNYSPYPIYVHNTHYVVRQQPPRVVYHKQPIRKPQPPKRNRGRR